MLKLEGFGVETTQKLKNAIIGKLSELGAYVDNELPNYILVMVANKKSKKQMAEDLELFLDDSTEQFTIWLQDFLQQLSASAKGSNKEIPKEKPKSIISSAPLKVEEYMLNDDFLTLKEEGDIDDPLMCELQENSEEISKSLENEDGNSNTSTSQITSRKIRISRSSIYALNTFTSKTAPPKNTLSHQMSASNVNKVKPIQIKRHSLPMSTIHRPPPSKPASMEESEEDESDSETKSSSIASVIKINDIKFRSLAPVQANSILLAKAVQEANKSVVTSPSKVARPPLGAKKTSRVSALNRLGKRFNPLPHKRRITVVKRQKIQEEQEDVESPEEPVTKGNLHSKKALHSVAGFTERLEEHKRLQRLSSMDSPITKASELEVPSTSIQVANSQLTLSPPSGDIRITLKRKVPPSDEENLSSAISPHFVVTLDGVDPDFLITSKRSRLSSISSSISKSNSVKQMDIDQNLDDLLLDEEETLEELEQLNVSKEVKMKEEECQTSPLKPSSISTSSVSSTLEIKERCRFWPACRLGDACSFHHPTSVCKNFPKCKFGDKCLYLHPTCKYDGICSKPDCPYTHTKKAPATIPTTSISSTFVSPRLGLGPQSKIVCRYFPKCTNLTCPFLHPKPCKFGANCMLKPACAFYHPPLPSFDQCRWVKPGVPSIGLSSSIYPFSLT